MPELRTFEGDIPTQCPEISSSTDVFSINSSSFHALPSISRFPSRRRSYRYPLNPLPHRVFSRETLNDPVPSVRIPLLCRGRSLETLSTKTALVYVVIIFLSAIFALWSVYASFPDLSEEEKPHIKIPWNIEQAKQLGLILDRYKHENFYQVLTGVFVTYIFLQTFAIPGSLFLSILSGFLFPFYGALILVCTCSAIGASLCFLLSQLLGRKLVLKYFPERANKWAVIVNKQRDNLFNYIVFLRVTPFLPNWFINLTAPVIGVPLKPFALGTFFGVAPPSFVAIQAGQTLHTMSATDSTFSWTSVTLLGVFAVASLIPIFLRDKLKSKFD